MRNLFSMFFLVLSFNVMAETCHESVNQQILNSSRWGIADEDKGRFLSSDKALEFISTTNTLDLELDGEYIHELQSLVTGEKFESYQYGNDAGGWLAISNRADNCKLVELVQIQEF